MGRIKLTKSVSRVHAIAKCENCHKEFLNYKNAQALAAIHAKAHGHIVIGEVGLSFIYEGVPDE